MTQKTQHPIRSILFVPGDNLARMQKAYATAADAVVIDLEDAVASQQKPMAREIVAAFLREHRDTAQGRLWVRINPVRTQDALLDLSAVMPGAPDVILLPKAAGPAEIERLSLYLDAFETRDGLPLGQTAIVPVATETAAASQSLTRYDRPLSPRLLGLTWGAEDLSADLGASTNRDSDGRLSLTYRMVRSQTLLAARACGVIAIDTVYPDFKDLDGLRESCLAAGREGFSACFAIHPAQIAVINAAFSPDPEAISHAKRVVAAFDGPGAAGAVQLDGKMLDRPHLVQAQKIMALAERMASATLSQ